MHDIDYNFTVGDIVWSFFENTVKEYRIIQITFRVTEKDDSEVIYHLLNIAGTNHTILRHDYEVFLYKQQALNYVGGAYLDITPSATFTATPTFTPTPTLTISVTPTNTVTPTVTPIVSLTPSPPPL